MPRSDYDGGMLQLTRRKVLQIGAATLYSPAITANASQPLDLSKFDPFAPATSHYAYVAKYVWKLESARELVNQLWLSYVNQGVKKHADWCFLYWYNYWRLVSLGENRIKTARIGVKMVEKVIAAEGVTAWNLFWKAAFLGLEAISKGVLDAAQSIAEFKKLMEESVRLDPTVYYANGYVGLAKLYSKAPPFPISVGDIDKGQLYLKLAEPHQRKKFALWYLFAADAYVALNEIDRARDVLGQLGEVKPPDVVSQIIFETTKIDAASLMKEVDAGTYNKYKWDPMFTPLDTRKILGAG